jgi:hypothetical protein
VARDRNPGIRRLAALVAAHREAFEADLIDRGLDLRDLWRTGGRLTWRLLGVVYRHLPPQSATMTALRKTIPADVLTSQSSDADPAAAPWSHDQMLAASQLDVLRLILHVLLAANGGNPGKPPAPTARPGVAGAKKPRRLTAEQRRLLDPRMRAPKEG